MVLKFLNLIGFAVCHQLPERSIYFGNHFLPVCARDTGIYLGFLISFATLNLFNRRKQSGFPPLGVLIVALLGIGLMAIDGLTSYLGLRETTNDIRLLTGLFTGFALPLILIPLFNYQVWSDSTNESIVRNIYHILSLFIALILAFFLIRSGLPFLYLPFSILLGFSIVLVFTYINFVLVSLIPGLNKRAKRLKDLILPFILALTLTIVELLFSYHLHSYLLSRYL